jgi:hypothetical protein
MPAGLVGVHSFKQNITGGGSFEALAAGTGDSLAIANYREGTRAYILEAWGGTSANPGEFSIRSARMHDIQRGLRMAKMFNPTLSGADGDPQLLLPYKARQPVYSSDVPIYEVNGTATDAVGLDTLIYYEDLPGLAQSLATWAEIQARIVNIVGIRVSVAAGAAGDWGATRAINADDDRLKADTYYAILGAESQLPALSLSLVSPDLSNFRVSLPLHWNQQISSGFFVDIADKYNIAAIPVINANNKANTLLQAADPGGAIATASTLILAELR